VTLPLTAGLRPLPRTIPPYRNEVLSSYLCRLALANRLDPDALRVHLTGQTRKTAAVPAERLAVLCGRPAAALRHAIPELTTPGDSANPGGSPPGRTLGLACQLCAVARTAHDQVWCWRGDEEVVCHRHRRWTGGGPGGRAFRQPDLSTQPDIVRAHTRHRRLVRRHGRQAAAVAFTAAAAICRTWHRSKSMTTTITGS